jgi:hypothetical protein
MPLSKPKPRQMLHQRDIVINGYLREDGLIDIEAHMTDRKPYSFSNHERGGVNAGEALHDMRLRVTIDTSLTILACEAAMDATPHSVCPGAAPNYGRLAGLVIGKGFLKQAGQLLGGANGCTHLRELLQQIGTVAMQTMYSVRRADRPDKPAIPGSRLDLRLLNTCYAYDENGPLVRRYRELNQG